MVCFSPIFKIYEYEIKKKILIEKRVLPENYGRYNTKFT